MLFTIVKGLFSNPGLQKTKTKKMVAVKPVRKLTPNRARILKVGYYNSTSTD
jgi:hypothetical protein